jgi:hypothetical protein
MLTAERVRIEPAIDICAVVTSAAVDDTISVAVDRPDEVITASPVESVLVRGSVKTVFAGSRREPVRTLSAAQEVVQRITSQAIDTAASCRSDGHWVEDAYAVVAIT